MAINRRINNRFARKADQEWELAGLARQDGDTADEKRHTDAARDYERQAREFERAKETVAEPDTADPVTDDDRRTNFGTF